MPDSKPRIPSQIWVLVAAAFVIAIGYGLVSPILPTYARSFDVGVTAASVIVSAFAFFRLVFAPAGGKLVTAFGERPVYMTGLLIVSASSIATAFAGSYGQLLLFRGLGGVGSTMFTISAMSLIVRLAPPSIRGRVSSAYGSSFLIGGMIGPVLGGFLAEFGLRTPFIVYGIALIIAATVVGVGLRGAKLRSEDSEDSTREVMPIGEAFASPVYRAALAAAVANGWVNFGVRNAVLPLLAATIYDQPWVAGAALATGAVGTAITLQFSGRLADSIGRRPLVITGLSIMGVAMATLGISHTVDFKLGLGILFTMSFLAGIGGGCVGPGQQAAVADVIGQDRNGGTVLSTFQMVQDGGAILGPILIGMAVDAVGFQLAFILTGAVCLLGLIPWVISPEPLTLQQANSE